MQFHVCHLRALTMDHVVMMFVIALVCTLDSSVNLLRSVATKLQLNDS